MLKIPVRGPDWPRTWLEESQSLDGQKNFLWQSFLQEVRRRWQSNQAPQHCLLVKSCRESLFLLIRLLIKVLCSEGIVHFFSIWECSTSIIMCCSGPFGQFRVIRYHSVLGISLRRKIIDVSRGSCLLVQDMSEGQQLNGMRVCLLQVNFSHDLHPPSYP